jgi:hypothetical protein
VGEKKSETKTEIRAKKGKENKINRPMTLVSTRTEKRIPSVHHPSRMDGALVGAGSLQLVMS